MAWRMICGHTLPSLDFGDLNGAFTETSYDFQATALHPVERPRRESLVT